MEISPKTALICAVALALIFVGADLMILNIYYKCINNPDHNRIYSRIDYNPRIISNGTELYLDNDGYTLVTIVVPFASYKLNFHHSDKTLVNKLNPVLEHQCEFGNVYSIRLFKFLRSIYFG